MATDDPSDARDEDVVVHVLRYNERNERKFTAYQIEEGKRRLRYYYRRAIDDGHFKRFHKGAEVALTLGLFARELAGHEHDLDVDALGMIECKVCGLTPEEIARLPLP